MIIFTNKDLFLKFLYSKLIFISKLLGAVKILEADIFPFDPNSSRNIGNDYQYQMIFENKYYSYFQDALQISISNCEDLDNEADKTLTLFPSTK